MPGPWPQIRIAQAVQEVVGPRQRVGDAELFLQDPDHVGAAERANAIRRLGLGERSSAHTGSRVEHEAKPDSHFRADVPWPRRIAFELLTELPHEHPQIG